MNHKELLGDNTPFALCAITALIIGVADVIVTSADLLWLAGDMTHALQPYHIYVGIILTSGCLLMLASFIWLYKGIHRYQRRRVKKLQQRQSDYLLFHTRVMAHNATHCDKKPPLIWTKKYYDHSYED